MEINLHSFFVLFLPSHLMENFFTTIFSFNEFIFVYVVNIRFICDGEIYVLTYLTEILLVSFLKYVVFHITPGLLLPKVGV